MFTGIIYLKVKKLIKLPKFQCIRVARFSGPDPVLGKLHRPQLQLQVCPPGGDSDSWVMEMSCCGCWAGIFMAQNCCRMGPTTAAGAGDTVMGHLQQWQSWSSLRHGWGYPWWLLSARDGCGCSPAELHRAVQLWCSWKDLMCYPWFSWAHSTCLNFDFSWFYLVHAMPVMFFKKSFSFSMNVYSSNLPDQKGFTFFFL